MKHITILAINIMIIESMEREVPGELEIAALQFRTDHEPIVHIQ